MPTENGTRSRWQTLALHKQCFQTWGVKKKKGKSHFFHLCPRCLLPFFNPFPGIRGGIQRWIILWSIYLFHGGKIRTPTLVNEGAEPKQKEEGSFERGMGSEGEQMDGQIGGARANKEPVLLGGRGRTTAGKGTATRRGHRRSPLPLEFRVGNAVPFSFCCSGALKPGEKKKKKGVRDFWWRSRSSPPNLCPDCFSLSLPSPSKPPMVLISSSSAGTPQTFLAPLWQTGQWGK